MGLEEDDDTLLILGRYALIEQQAEQQEYLDTVPLDVWRLTSLTQGAPLDILQTVQRRWPY